MVIAGDIGGAIKKASYEALLEIFEGISALYYTAKTFEQRQEFGDLIVAVSREAHRRGVPTCGLDLTNRDVLVRNAIIRSREQAA